MLSVEVQQLEIDQSTYLVSDDGLAGEAQAYALGLAQWISSLKTAFNCNIDPCGAHINSNET